MTASNHIFLDLDGTLTDPKQGITRCIQHALEQLGEPVLPTESLTWCIGPPLLESFAQLVGAERAPQAVALYRERFQDVGLFENTLYPDIPKALQQLRSAGCRLYLATSKPLIFARRIVRHFELEHHFTELFGSELNGALSDKADLLAHGLAMTGVDPQAALMVGDRKHDMLGAKAVGIAPIGVLYGYGDAAELLGHGAQSLLRVPAELGSLGHLARG